MGIPPVSKCPNLVATVRSQIRSANAELTTIFGPLPTNWKTAKYRRGTGPGSDGQYFKLDNQPLLENPTATLYPIAHRGQMQRIEQKAIPHFRQITQLT